MSKQNKYYVSSTDTFMSGWGDAKGKKNILIFECDSLEEAEIVAENAENRTDQENIKITSHIPMYPTARCHIQHKTIANYPKWYEKDAF